MNTERDELDEFIEAVAAGAPKGGSTPTQPDNILANALAANAATGEDRLIDEAEDWVRKNSHPEQAGAILDLIDYAREKRAQSANQEGVDQSDWLYAWQVLQAGVWNLLGMELPNGQVLPMVTMRAHVAADMQNYARAHAQTNGLPVRLISFVPGAILQTIAP